MLMNFQKMQHKSLASIVYFNVTSDFLHPGEQCGLNPTPFQMHRIEDKKSAKLRLITQQIYALRITWHAINHLHYLPVFWIVVFTPEK